MRQASSSAEYSRPASDAPAAQPRAVWDLRANLLNVAAALTVLIIVAVILKELRVVLQPLCIAVFLFYLAHPLVKILVRRRVPPALAHLLILGTFGTLLVLFAALLVERVDDLGRQLPEFQERVKRMAAATADEVPNDLPFFRRNMRVVFSRVDIVSPLSGAVSGFMSGVVPFFSATVLVVLYFVFLVHEQKALPARLVSIYGTRRAEEIQAVGERINRSIARYMYIKFLASLFTAVTALAAMLIFGLELAVLWATILFLLNFIPYVGSIVGFLFPLAVAILQFPDVWRVLALAAIFTAIDVFVGNYWEPRVAGQRLNLSPLVVVFALAFWGWLWGAVGMILSVPITVSLRFVLENIPYTRSLATLISSQPATRSAP